MCSAKGRQKKTMAKSMHMNQVCVGARLAKAVYGFGTGKVGVLVIAIIFLKSWAILYLCHVSLLVRWAYSMPSGRTPGPQRPTVRPPRPKYPPPQQVYEDTDSAKSGYLWRFRNLLVDIPCRGLRLWARLTIKIEVRTTEAGRWPHDLFFSCHVDKESARALVRQHPVLQPM